MLGQRSRGMDSRLVQRDQHPGTASSARWRPGCGPDGARAPRRRRWRPGSGDADPAEGIGEHGMGRVPTACPGHGRGQHPVNPGSRRDRAGRHPRHGTATTSRPADRALVPHCRATPEPPTTRWSGRKSSRTWSRWPTRARPPRRARARSSRLGLGGDDAPGRGGQQKERHRVIRRERAQVLGRPQGREQRGREEPRPTVDEPGSVTPEQDARAEHEAHRQQPAPIRPPRWRPARPTAGRRPGPPTIGRVGRHGRPVQPVHELHMTGEQECCLVEECRVGPHQPQRHRGLRGQDDDQRPRNGIKQRPAAALCRLWRIRHDLVPEYGRRPRDLRVPVPRNERGAGVGVMGGGVGVVGAGVGAGARPRTAQPAHDGVEGVLAFER